MAARRALQTLLQLCTVRQGPVGAQVHLFESACSVSSLLQGRQQLLCSLSDFKPHDFHTSAVSPFRKQAEAADKGVAKRNETSSAKSVQKAAGSSPDSRKQDRLPSYKQLLKQAEQPKGVSLSVGAAKRIAHILREFQRSGEIRDRALALYVKSSFFPEVAAAFRKLVLSGLTEDLRDALLATSTEKGHDILFRYFAEFVVDKYSKDIREYREFLKTTDLRKPHLWFPVARSLKRKFIYHAGPTNSGKTFNALEAMKRAKSGVYCGPLRLLAMEIYDVLNASGTFCDLITGQERRLVPGATHMSCTIEMTSMTKRVDVAVIDEIQLLGDEQRGWAWTRALQGIAANEVHLCGDGSAIPLVTQLAKAMGEEVEVCNYERFTPIEVEEEGLKNGYKDAQPGDCIVAFSRRNIYEIKNIIESSTGLRVCVVYGALPPETRRQQAKLFNDEDNEYSVMVASDAVGMGLNLNIRRIIFNSLLKFQGSEMQQISVSAIKQIAGRAGRRNSQFPKGYVTCLNAEDIPAVKAALAVPMEELSTPAAGLFPEFEHLEARVGQSLTDDFGSALREFAREARLDGLYFFSRQESLQEAAKLLSRVPELSLQERYWFCNAPVSLREPRNAAALLHFAMRFAAKEPVALHVAVPQDKPTTAEELQHMENLHQVVSMWLWLSQRFEPQIFPGREEAEELSQKLIEQMEGALESMYTNATSDMPLQQPARKRPTPLEAMVARPNFVLNMGKEARDMLEDAEAERMAILRKRRAAAERQAARTFPNRVEQWDKPPQFARAFSAMPVLASVGIK